MRYLRRRIASNARAGSEQGAPVDGLIDTLEIVAAASAAATTAEPTSTSMVPSAFDAVMTTESSPSVVGTQLEAVAPGILTPSRFHWKPHPGSGSPVIVAATVKVSPTLRHPE